MIILETERLSLHPFTLSDARFLLDVMNQPDYHRFIGDRGLRDVADAENYIDTKMIPTYELAGFGFWLLRDLSDGTPVGFGGILKRDELDCPDIGYAIHESLAGHGYAQEVTRGLIKYSRSTLGLDQVCAITDPENHPSINVLLKCGFHFKEASIVFDDEPALSIYLLNPGSLV